MRSRTAVLGRPRTLAIVNGTVAAVIIASAHAAAFPPAETIRLALTALLATVPVALPATFTLSAALGAQRLARHGVLVTRLSAGHEAAAMDLLCVDKTGTLTRNTLEIVDVVAMPGHDRERVLTLAALASSDADQDPIDAAIRAAAPIPASVEIPERRVQFEPFDPVTQTAEAVVLSDRAGERRVIKGAIGAIAQVAVVPADTRRSADDLAAQVNRVLAVATGPAGSLRLAGLIALSDPPRDDSAALVASLRDMSVRTIMVTGDSAVTAAAIARAVGIDGMVCPPELVAQDRGTTDCGVFARIVPEAKYRLVPALQHDGHVVGMCGDGVNDAPALRQAQVGIAVASATDAAKAAAGLILTEPGLTGIVSAIREGRCGFQRLVSYTLNMLAKRVEVVLLLAIGLGLTGHAVMTPVLMVLLMVTNDLLSMSLTADHATPATAPSVWRMRHITAVALSLGLCKLVFSVSLLALGVFRLELGVAELQTLAFVTLVFGNQALMYVLRERRRLWRSMPSQWVLASSAVDLTVVSLLAWSGTLMAPLPWRVLATVLAAAIGFAGVLDQIKLPVMAAFEVE